MSLGQLFQILRASVWSIVLMMLVCVGVAVGLAESLPKEYTAKARVMLDLSNPDPTQYTAIGRTAVAPYIVTQVRLVADPGVAALVVKALGWDTDPAVIAAWEESTGGVGDVVKWAAGRLGSSIAAQQLEDSAIIEIFYSASNPDVAKRIVGLVRTAYIDNNLRLRVDAAKRAAAWNTNQATLALADLLRAEKTRVDFTTAHHIVVTLRGNTDTRDLTQLGDMSTKAMASKKLIPQNPRSGILLTLKQKLNNLEAQIAAMQGAGPESPDMQIAMAQRSQLQTAIAREVILDQAQDNTTVNVTQQDRIQLDAQYLQARLQLLDQAPLYDKLAQIDRDISLRQRLYDAAQQRAASFDLAASAQSGLRVIGDVIGDDEPSFPNVPLMAAIAAVFGAALGVSIALLGELMARRVRGSEDLAFSSRVPVLAVIGKDPPARRVRRWWRLGRRSRSNVPTLQPAE